MSTDTEHSVIPSLSKLANVRQRLFEIIFGDVGGAFVFLVVFAGAMLLWRFTFTINDNFVIANGLAAVADGHLYVDQAVYGDSIQAPGMVTANGQAYPRNIGHIVFSLPFLVLIKALTSVMAPQVAAAMLWSLALLGACVTCGLLFNHERVGQLLGSGIAILAFAANLGLTTPGPTGLEEYVALQLSTIVLASFTSVLLYRVCVREYGFAVGIAVGLAAGLATPALFWASVPKRHVVTAAFAVLSLYFLYRSREAEQFTAYRRFRLLAYVPVGLTAWVFVGEGALLFLALIGVDLLTARENSLRSLLGIGAAVILSSIPFFVTNYLISGNPLTSPMMLPQYSSVVETSVGGTDSTSSKGVSSPSLRGASDGSLLPPPIQQILYFLDQYRFGLEIALNEPDRLYHTFVRSGFIDFPRGGGATGLAINLTFLESMPLAGALLGLPVLIVRRIRSRVFEPIHAVDAFVISYAVLTTLLYIRGLPLHAQLTVRYLYPLFPLAVYGCTRVTGVQDVIQTRASWLLWTYAGSVFIGAQLLLAGFVLIDATVDEAMQGFAILGLLIATILGLWSFAASLDRGDTRVGAVLLAMAAAVGTNLMLVTIIYFFGTGFALPVIPSF